MNRTAASLGIAVAVVAGALPVVAAAQGCVAIRSSQTSSVMRFFEAIDAESRSAQTAGRWEAGMAYRWLHSHRHFVGDDEQEQRRSAGTEVINDSNFWDIALQYHFNERMSLSATVPIVSSDRSSLYEHDRRNRHHSQASGIGDVRVMGYYWLRDPQAAPRVNVLIGIGPKFPTGDYRAQDTFQTVAGPVRSNVDQSIQPGDGGLGMNLELGAVARLGEQGSAYLQLSYLFNPKNTNGVSSRTGTARGNPYEQIMSVTDQYFGRVGVTYELAPRWGLAASLGARIDGVPVHDAIGSSDGFRRPGYAVAIEPGISFATGANSFNLTVPYALYRNRERSLADQRWTRDTGVFRHGDAAFADYFVTASYVRKF
jgi:hypothetical protein